MNTTTQATPEFCPNLTVIDGQIKTTSIAIAEHFGKQHYRVLRAIESLECSVEFRAANFGVSSYRQEMPGGGFKENPAYEITRDGFVFLAMGFTGKQAAQWKEAYIKAFNQMESELLENTQPPKLPTKETIFADKAALIESLRTRLFLCIEKSQITSIDIISEDTCAINPNDAKSLRTLLKECVPIELMPIAMEIASQRIMALLPR